MVRCGIDCRRPIYPVIPCFSKACVGFNSRAAPFRANIDRRDMRTSRSNNIARPAADSVSYWGTARTGCRWCYCASAPGNAGNANRPLRPLCNAKRLSISGSTRATVSIRAAGKYFAAYTSSGLWRSAGDHAPDQRPIGTTNGAGSSSRQFASHFATDVRADPTASAPEIWAHASSPHRRLSKRIQLGQFWAGRRVRPVPTTDSRHRFRLHLSLWRETNCVTDSRS